MEKMGNTEAIPMASWDEQQEMIRRSIAKQVDDFWKYRPRTLNGKEVDIYG